MENFTRLIQYLSGEMPEQEMIALREQLAQDPALREELETAQTMLNGVQAHGDRQLKNRLSDLEASLEKEGFYAALEPAPANNPKRRILLLALILILAIAAALLWRPAPAPPQAPPQAPPTLQSPPSTPLPAEQYAQRQPAETAQYSAYAQSRYKAPSFSLLRGAQAENADQAVLDSALVLYQEKQFSKAAALLEQHHFNTNTAVRAQVLQAHTAFARRQYDKARQLLEAVVTGGVMPYSEESQYYLLLCYLTDFPRREKQFQNLAEQILKDPLHPDHQKTKTLVAQLPVSKKPAQ